MESDSVMLRDAVSTDAVSIASIYLLSRRTFFDYAPLAHSDPDVRQWIADTLIPGGGVRVALVGTTVTGFIATSYEDKHKCSWIDQLYLHPDFTGRGIGTLLIEWAKQSLHPPIRLYTFQQNSASRRFYERHGFRLVNLSDGTDNEERCPDALYEYPG